MTGSPLLQIDGIDPYLRRIIDHRKSGLSLNHVIGCPLDCAYCVRHLWGNFEMKQPQSLCTDEQAVEALLSHPSFESGKTPVQVFNKATDPFLPQVRTHTHNVLRLLDAAGADNIVLLITRAKVLPSDVEFLESLINVRPVLFFTYSGIADQKIEPIGASQMTPKSIALTATARRSLPTVLYWRPIVHGWNDDEVSIGRVLDLAEHVDAIVFSGYYQRDETVDGLASLGIDVPYADAHRRKILNRDLEGRILNEYFSRAISTPIFRKTSCGASYVLGRADFNGHWGIRDLCDICPMSQRERCGSAFRQPAVDAVRALVETFDPNASFELADTRVVVDGLTEEQRYFLQHHFSFQFWDARYPHRPGYHGRATSGDGRAVPLS